jgi:hypothetical protein
MDITLSFMLLLADIQGTSMAPKININTTKLIIIVLILTI